MPIGPDGQWYLRTSPKQDELRALCKQFRYVLANGPRYSGKTIGCYECIMDHCWDVPNANFAIITISQTVGMDSGVWKDITEVIIPDRISGNYGLEWVKQPYIQSTSKKPACQITNKYGGVATLQLESLKVEEEAEDRFKPRRYTGIYVPELTTFHSRGTFDCWTECLRTIGLPDNMHLFLADTNPPDDQSWWIHDVWWDLLEISEQDLADPDVLQRFFLQLKDKPDLYDLAFKSTIALKRSLARIDITIADNPFADPDHVLKLQAKYAHNDELYRRYINGECVRTTTDSLFHKVFRPSFHVIGEIKTAKIPDPEIMVPEPGCYELITGWDPGISNSSAHIAEKPYRIVEFTDKDGIKKERKEPILKYVDELCIIDEPHSLLDFVLAFMKKMQFWEDYLERQGKIVWKHWSDRSVLDMVSPESKKYFHQIIFEASVQLLQEGYDDEKGVRKPFTIAAPIILEAAPRGPGSVQQRVDLWSKLLFDERAYFSAEKCPFLINAIKSLKKGTNSVQVIQKGSKHKHSFDSASYLACSELQDELTRAVISNLINQRRSGESGASTIITTPI